MLDEDQWSDMTTRQWTLRWCSLGSGKNFQVIDLTEVSDDAFSRLIAQPHWSLERAALLGRGWLFENAHEEADFFVRIRLSRYTVPEALALLSLRELLSEAHTAGLLSAGNTPNRIAPAKVVAFLNEPPFPARHPDDEIELPPSGLISASKEMEPYSKVAKERDKLKAELAGIYSQTKGRRTERAHEWAKLLWAWAALKVEAAPTPKSPKAARALAANAIIAEFEDAAHLIVGHTPQALKLENWIAQVEKELGRPIIQLTEAKDES